MCTTLQQTERRQQHRKRVHLLRYRKHHRRHACVVPTKRACQRCQHLLDPKGQYGHRVCCTALLECDVWLHCS